MLCCLFIYLYIHIYLYIYIVLIVPESVSMLRDCGLDSLRVSINSVRPRYFNSYLNVLSKEQTNDDRNSANGAAAADDDDDDEGPHWEDLFAKAKESLKIMKVG